MKVKKLEQNYTPSALEEEVLKYWKENKTFEKSVENRSKENSYSFYDGPPFITGMPHYGHLLGSIIKDLVPRYQTMKGKRVERVWGWDCHGLPAENKVEKQLGINSKKEIEELGIDKFVAACKDYVNNVSEEWEWYVDHIGRWVDFKNAYRTMDDPYMESVLWVFKSLYEKGVIYKGKRVSLFCPRCSTPISNFEVAMDNTYRDVTDPSVFVKFKIKDQDRSIIAWTTTPWTLPSNMALAVSQTANYGVYEVDGEELVVATDLATKVFERELTPKETLTGSDLVGLSYLPLYPYAKVSENDHKIYAANFVSLEDGTGIVHIAPGFGEDDTELGKLHKLSMFESVDDEGKLKPEIAVAAGQFFKKADKTIIEDLKTRNLLQKQSQFTHSYPHCHRCDTPLLYKAQEAWYINVQDLKEDLLKTNEPINWVPEYFKTGRFQQGIESAPDWCISRSRYWGAPIPVWECDKCDKIFVAGSISEIEERSGSKLVDLHRPGIDSVIFDCECGGKMHRVPEVLDSWIEAASMPYAERHYPFENKEVFEKSFPGDFITEYTGQLRAWFYVMHVISNSLIKHDIIPKNEDRVGNSFKNVIVTGVILGTDGRKMSKNYGNYPDPRDYIVKYGADSLRLYLMSSPLASGQDVSISEADWQEHLKTTLNMLYNSYKFFVNYASLEDFEPQGKISTNPLDQWIVARLKELSNELDTNLSQYQIPKAISSIRPFVDDLSTWYIRRSRDRVGPSAENENDKIMAYETMSFVFENLFLILSPIIPFLSEYLYRHLTDKESVHLGDWPTLGEISAEEEVLIKQMVQVRDLVSLGHNQRKNSDLPIKQPLSSATITNKEPLSNQLAELIAQELNVLSVTQQDGDFGISLDTDLTDELIAKGELRKLIREVQEARKQAECDLNEVIDLVLPDWPKQYEAELKRKALVDTLKKGDKLEVIRK